MDLVGGLAGLRTAVELARALRDAAKAGTIKQDEFAGRVGEIYDYITDSKDALVDAKDQVWELKQKLTELEAELKRREAMKFAYGAYWTKDDGAFCQLCWESEHKVIRLSRPIVRIVAAPPSENIWYTCYFHQETRIALPEDLKAFREKLSIEGRFA